MKVLVVLTFWLALSGLCSAQDNFSATMTNNSLITVTLESSLEPALPALSGKYSMGVSTKKGMSRYAINFSTHEYFGYDIQVRPVPQQNGYFSVAFSELSLNAQELSLPDASIWVKLPTPISPAPEIIKGSDAIALDVFVNAATGQKIVDYIRIKANVCETDAADLPQCLQMADLVLAAKTKLLEHSRDSAAVEAMKQSQPLWERYRDQACSGLSTQSKRLRCEILITRSRTDDLGKIY